jgi:hypothetical protein
MGLVAYAGSILTAFPAVDVILTEVPDYAWDAGCFGTASGNLMGYWDRHGFPDFYTGPTGGGIAPLTSEGSNQGIKSLWASRAGLDGRPSGQFGHMDDYWTAYENTGPDPYALAGRAEHSPDCIGDFTGLSQNKWTNMDDECDGNIDAFSFVFWESSGKRRTNYSPEPQNGEPVPDIPSGLRAWTAYRGYESDAFSQLAEFNPNVPTGNGFTFADLQGEIDAGYPVLIFMQQYNEFSRSLPGMPKANPEIHGMLAYGYYVSDSGERYVRYRTSWASGDRMLSPWSSDEWQAQLPVRGFIGYHPQPQITQSVGQGNTLQLAWDGPSSVLSNLVDHTSAPAHWYVVERATTLSPANFAPVSEPTADRSVTVTNCCSDVRAFYRLKMLAPAERPSSP